MKIEVSPHAQQKSVLVLSSDEGFLKEVHASIFGRHFRWTYECHSMEEFEKQFFSLEYSKAKEFASKRLAMQALPSKKLAFLLQERLVSQETIDRIIKKFDQLGYLNDEEWTEGFVRNQLRNKRGPRLIAQKLFNKGIEKEFIEEALEKVSLEEQRSLIFYLLKTRYAGRSFSNFREKQKVIASLIRRGFELNLINSCFAELND